MEILQTTIMLKSPRYLKTLLIVYILFSLGAELNAQEVNQEQKARIDKLNDLARKNLLKPDSLIIYSNQAYELSKQENYPYGLGNALKFKGIYEHSKSNFDTAIRYYGEAMDIFKGLNDELEVGKANLNIATSYNSMLNYPLSIRYGLEALKSFRKLNDPNGEGRVLNLLGIVSFMQKDFPEALNFFLQYNRLATKAGDENEVASSLSNIGSTYEELGKLDSAILFHRKVLKFEQDKGSKSNLGMSYQNIGGLYNKTGKYNEGLKYHKLSLKAFQEAGDRKYLAHSYYNIGLSYKQLKDTVNALKWFKSAIKQAQEVKETEILKNTYEQLAGFEAAGQDFKKAYENLVISSSMKDSILDLDKTKIIEDLKVQYETEKKELQIIELNQQTRIQQLEISQKNSYLLAAAALTVLIIFVAYFLFNRRKIKEEIRIQEERNHQQEILVKEVLNAEERERRRIAEELHDGVGQTLSAALLNLNGFIEKAAPQEEQLKKLADRSIALMGESYDELRLISHQMIPNALLKSGLATAIREFISRIDQNKLKVSLDIAGLNEKLDENTETVIYRVIQEATTNVIKHAKASKLSIQLIKDKDGINASIEDDGIGFDQSILKTSNGIGLKNIQNRILSLNGSIDFDSRPGKGTLLTFTLPA